MNTQFGRFLKNARLNSGIRTQQAAADELRRRGRKVSQGLIAQYETGRINDPDPVVLRLLSDIYKKDYLEVVLRLVHDKYDHEQQWSKASLAGERWKLIWATLKSSDVVGGVHGLEQFQLRAKAELIEKVRILRLDGMVEWQRNYPDLEVFWVVVPDFADHRDARLQDVVVYNLKRGVKYVYFVRELDDQVGGRFWSFKRALTTVLPQSVVETQTLAIPLKQDVISLLKADIVIANPHLGSRGVAFENIRRGGKIAFSIEMSEFDLGFVQSLAKYAHDTHQIDAAQILPPPRPKYERPTHDGVDSMPERVN